MKVKGSVSLITGGAQGFGRAFSRELLKRGSKVLDGSMYSAVFLQLQHLGPDWKL